MSERISLAEGLETNMHLKAVAILAPLAGLNGAF